MRDALLPDDDARELVIACLDHLADWPIKSAERFRNAALGGAMAFNPLLPIENLDDAGLLKRMIRGTISEGRMIDFGFLPNDLLKAESIRSRALFEAGELQHPYDDWLGVTAWEGGMNGYHISPHPFRPELTLCVELYGIEMPGRGAVILLYDIISVDAKPGDTGVYPMPMKGREYETDQDRSLRGANSLDPLVTMLRLLADASVPVVDHPEPVKLNKQRLRKGLFPIPAHSAVQTRDYVAAFRSLPTPGREAKGGHHASPIAHWRRAHMRRLADGRLVPVRSTKVNWRDTEEYHRLFYRVPKA